MIQHNGVSATLKERHVLHSRSSNRLPRTTHHTRWRWRTGGLSTLPRRRCEAATLRKIVPPSSRVTSRDQNSSSMASRPHFGRLLLVLNKRQPARCCLFRISVRFVANPARFVEQLLSSQCEIHLWLWDRHQVRDLFAFKPGYPIRFANMWIEVREDEYKISFNACKILMFMIFSLI